MSAHTPEPDVEQHGGFTDDPKASSVIFSGAVGTLVLIVTIIVLQALVYQYEAAENEKKAVNQVWSQRVQAQTRQEVDLQSYRWVDREKGVVGIPIDVAAQRVAADLARGAGD